MANIKNMKRCPACFSLYSKELDSCPECWYSGDNIFYHEYGDLLSIGTRVDRYTIGRPISIDSESISYLAWDEKKNRKTVLKEFFISGIMSRDDQMMCEFSYDCDTEKVIGRMRNFARKKKNVIYANNTLYIIDKYDGMHPDDDGVSYNVELRTWIGRRERQEDKADYISDHSSLLAVLCDGMGGLNAGDVTSSFSCGRMIKYFDTIKISSDDLITKILTNIITEIDNEVYSQLDLDDNRISGGSTMVCVYISDSKMWFASVGDSRIYLIRDNEIKQLTTDQNLRTDIEIKLSRGEYVSDELLDSPLKEALTGYIGMGNLTKVCLSETPIRLSDNDIILLCSDGLYRTLTLQELLGITDSDLPLSDISDQLLYLTEEKNKKGQDNTTFILIKKRKD
ncbi:MAG: protein serine/threonine phosphatase 2C family protein [Oscillospiraceae bacterium]|nr:protein serine/threonine phosphatase 2C family protein [Oscillospiraceae bacterium]